MGFDELSISNRLTCALTEFFIFVFILGLLSTVIENILVLFASDLFKEFRLKELKTILFYLDLFIIFNKDFFNGQSPIKSIFGFRVVDQKTGTTASDFKCFVRNMTIILWPIEVIVLLFSTDKRLGDMIAGTRIIFAEKKSITKWFGETKNKKYSFSTLTTIFLSLIYLTIIWCTLRLIQH
jgi:uncharacterized RDD family membrane protein YckC